MRCNLLKIRYLFVVGVLFLSNPIFAQNIDSLKIIISKGEAEQKVNAAISISNFYFYSEPDSAEFYLKQALGIIDDNKIINKKGGIYINLGILYNEKGITSIAEKYFNLALSVAEAEKDSSILLASLGNLGNSAMYNGDYVNALTYFTKVLALYEVKGNFKGMGNTYGAIGNVFIHLKKDEKALYYYSLADKNFTKAKDTLSRAIILLNEASVYTNIGKFDTARVNYLAAYDIFMQHSQNLAAAQCLEGLADLYLQSENYEKADEYLLQSLAIYKNLDAQKNISGSYNMLGSNYLEQKKYLNAVRYYDSAYQVALNLNNYKLLSEAAEGLQLSYYNQGNYKNAYKYSVLNKAFADSVLNIESAEKISELEIEFETTQKEQKIELLTKENEISQTKHERDKWLIIMLLVAVVLSLVIFIMIFNRQKLINNQKQLITEQKLLRLQMNPHFIFNSLLAIQNYMFENDAEKATYYLSSFAKLMRKILESSRKDYISLEEELEILKNYVDFQKFRLKKSFEFIIQIDDNIDQENILIPPMLIQPFVENSIKHAFTSEVEKPQIIVSFNQEKNIILAKIIDNGIGIKNSTKINNEEKEHKSLALKITRERLENIFGRKNRKNIIFTVENLCISNPEETGTIVTIGMPFKEEF